MTSNKKHTARKLAEKLLDFPENDWNRLIGEWCAGDDNLKRKVNQIADTNRNARNFVEEFQKRIYSLTKSSLSSSDNDPLEVNGFKVVRRLGSGGSATVYLVKHESGRKGALKLLRGIAVDEYSRKRFESERHILATLDHPNIAKLIEGGITSRGEPYVIMEYVDGIPIDEWCDQHKLDVNQRIRLFQDVCRAVHYAHQNLVVHRDIKPDHVLITPDGNVKLIDFGIAKLLQPDNPDITAFQTRTGMRIMTPEFASPEQVRGQHITTASDIYSLGVLLYLLLTGRKPYQINTTSMLDIEKVVCETDPVRPSDAVLGTTFSSGNSADLPSGVPVKTAELHGLEPHRLRKTLSGDLDRIILMAMWKEPQRRYSSALAFSDDLENFLNGEPISARAPTLRYRVRKFVYRNKAAVAAASIAIIALAGGISGILWQAREARFNAERAEIQAQRAEQVSAFLAELFEGSDPTKANDGSMTAREMLDQGFEKIQNELADQPAVQAQMLGIIGKVYQNLGLYDQSQPALEQAVESFRNIGEISPQYVSVLLELANLEYRMGLLDQAEMKTKEVLSLNIGFYGENHPEVASVLNTLAIIYEGKDEMEDATRTLRRVVEIRRQEEEPGSNLAANLNNLAILLHRTGELDESDELFREAIEVVKEIWGEEHPYMAFTLNGYSGLLQERRHYSEAEETLHRALEIGLSVFPEEHPFVAVVLHNLGKLFEETGNYQNSATYYEKGLELRRKSLPPRHPDIASSLDGLGVVLVESGRADEAEPLLREALSIRQSAFNENDWRIAQVEAHLGRSLLRQQRIDEAKIYLQKSHTTLLETRGEDDIHVNRVLADLNQLSGYE